MNFSDELMDFTHILSALLEFEGPLTVSLEVNQLHNRFVTKLIGTVRLWYGTWDASSIEGGDSVSKPQVKYTYQEYQLHPQTRP